MPELNTKATPEEIDEYFSKPKIVSVEPQVEISFIDPKDDIVASVKEIQEHITYLLTRR